MTHYHTDRAVQIRHQALNGIPIAFSVGRDINNAPNLITLAGFLRKISQIEVLERKKLTGADFVAS